MKRNPVFKDDLRMREERNHLAQGRVTKISFSLNANGVKNGAWPRFQYG